MSHSQAACDCLCEKSQQLLDRTYSIAAQNLARAAEELSSPSEAFKALQPYPWSFPVYQATDRQSKRALEKKHKVTAGTVREIWSLVLKQSSRVDRIALRDTCRTLKDLYYIEEYKELSLKKFVFNARYPDEILVLDWRSRREKDPPRAAGMPSCSSLPRRFTAVPVLRPAHLYEREKKVLHTVFFETIVFEEFRQPSYIPDAEWTSRATFHAGIETPAGHVLLETSLAAEPLYVCPGHEHGSVMCERWTRLVNREWIEYMEAEVPPLDDQATTSASASETSSMDSSRTSSPSERHRDLPNDSVVIADGDDDVHMSGSVKNALATKSHDYSDLDIIKDPAEKAIYKGKGREGEKRRYQVATAPVDLIAGFSSQAVSEIVVGRFKSVKGEKWPLLGPIERPKNFERNWSRGISTVSKAYYRDGPLLIFLTERAAGWMPVNATDPIVFNNMQPIMHKFTLEHLEAVAHYLNLPPLPPPSKCRNPSVSTQDFLWRTFLGTNSLETDSLPSTIKDAISGMVMESWRRTIYHEPVSKESPFCSRCATLVCNIDRHTDLTPSLNLLKKESAKLRRATAALRFYKATCPSCPCAACKKSAERRALLDRASALASKM